MLDLFQTNSCRVSGRLYFHPAWGKLGSVKKAVRFMVGLLLFGSAVFPAQAAFTNLYVFGDALSTTTNNPATGPLYYGQRYSNGRVWVEVLAQRQGLTYNSNQNWSYFGNTSTSLVANVSSFNAPSGASNALFVVWVNNADLYYPALSQSSSMSLWTNAINQSQTNHYKAVTNLYYARVPAHSSFRTLWTFPQFHSLTITPTRLSFTRGALITTSLFPIR